MGFELANSNSPPFFPPKSLKPLPSSIFFATLSLAFGDTFRASTFFGLNASQEFSIIKAKKESIVMDAIFFM